eukprot:23830-Rhodomonas_salina.3
MHSDCAAMGHVIGEIDFEILGGTVTSAVDESTKPMMRVPTFKIPAPLTHFRAVPMFWVVVGPYLEHRVL